MPTMVNADRGQRRPEIDKPGHWWGRPPIRGWPLTSCHQDNRMFKPRTPGDRWEAEDTGTSAPTGHRITGVEAIRTLRPLGFQGWWDVKVAQLPGPQEYWDAKAKISNQRTIQIARRNKAVDRTGCRPEQGNNKRRHKQRCRITVLGKSHDKQEVRGQALRQVPARQGKEDNSEWKRNQHWGGCRNSKGHNKTSRSCRWPSNDGDTIKDAAQQAARCHHPEEED